MRVLLSGGNKTDNILAGVSKKFQSSGDDFIVVNFIDDVNDLFAKGDYFDKAIVTEQSLTREYTIKEESEIRVRINKFAMDMAARPNRANFVFLTQSETLANMIHEEILPIFNDSVVVLKEPKYSVQFFYELIVTDVKQLPSDIVYVPDIDEAIDDNIDDSIDDDLSMDDVDFDNDFQYNPKEADDNFDKELFGDEGIDMVTAQDNISDELGINEGEDISFEVQEEVVNNDPIDNGPKDIFVSGGFSSNDLNNDEDLDDSFDFNDTTTFGNDEMSKNDNFQASSDLPDYVDNSIQPEQASTAFIPGFDEDENEEQDMEFDNSDYDNTASQSMENQFFDENMYEPETTGAQLDNSFTGNVNYVEENNTGSEDMFDMSDYSEDDYEEETVNMNDQTYQGEYQQGFISSNDYDDEEAQRQEMQNRMEQMNQVQNPPVMNNNNKKKKIGFLSKKNAAGVAGASTAIAAQQQQQMAPPVPKKKGKSIDSIKSALAPFASRGNSIVITGCGGCGTSTVAYSLAKIISKLGFTVLLVDMDTEGKTQNYISYNNFNSMEHDGANLMAAVNSSNGINTHLSVVDQGFHLLTMGIGSDSAPVNELLHKEKISRFVNSAKTSHNFVIYDIPFKDASGYLSDITYMADNLVMVLEANNWGVTKAMLNMCNVASEDMQETLFTRTQLVFNKFRNVYKIMGKKVKTCADITRVIDQKVIDLTGDDSGYHFEDLHIAGIINDDPRFNEGWYEQVQFVDTEPGMQIFLDLIEKIILRR